MKRLLATLLLVLLPLGWAWSAVGAYCAHEEDKSAAHFGHHMHQHASSSDHQDKDKPAGGTHPDCGTCHLGASGLPTDELFALAPIDPPSFGAEPTSAIRSIDSSGPERPQWSRPL